MIYVWESVSSVVRKFFFSPWVSFCCVRLELRAFHIFRSVPKAASSCSGDQIARQEIRKQQEQRKAGCTGLKCFFGIAVKGFVRNLRWRIINVMELNMSFIHLVGVFSPLFIPRSMAVVVFAFFLQRILKTMSLLGSVCCCTVSPSETRRVCRRSEVSAELVNRVMAPAHSAPSQRPALKGVLRSLCPRPTRRSTARRSAAPCGRAMSSRGRTGAPTAA